MNLKLKDILMVAICAVLFGVVYLGMTYFGSFLTTVLTPSGLGSWDMNRFTASGLWQRCSPPW